MAADEPADKSIPGWMKRNYLTMGWTSAAPLWHTFDRTEGFSPAGASLTFHLRITKHISAGPDLTWQLFDGFPSKITTDANGGSDGDSEQKTETWQERRFLYAGLSIHFYPTSKRDTMLPFLGVSAGVLRVREKHGIMPVNGGSDTLWHFAAIPELGIYLLHGRIPVWLSVRLFTGFPTQEHNGEMFMAFTLGVATPN